MRSTQTEQYTMPETPQAREFSANIAKIAALKQKLFGTCPKKKTNAQGAVNKSEPKVEAEEYTSDGNANDEESLASTDDNVDPRDIDNQ